MDDIKLKGCPLATRWQEIEARTKLDIDDEDTAYHIGVQDGFSEAVQLLDLMTGGDGEYFASTIPGRGCPSPIEMGARIVARSTGAFDSEKVEAVARAITGVGYGEREHHPWDCLKEQDPEDAEFTREQARAAIAALTESPIP